MSRAAALMRLQTIDSQIDAHRNRLAEIDRALGQDVDVSAARSALAEVQAALAEGSKTARSFEAEVQSVVAKGKEVETTLYGGKVTHPKELRDLQNDLASLQRRRAALEDKLLEAMVDVESGETAEKAALARLAEAETALQKSHGTLTAERAKIESTLARLAIEREAAEAPIPVTDRELYGTLRQRKRGLAVARLEDGACAACGVAPSSSRAQAVRQENAIIFCGNCERILYAE
ncbi:MAG: hypothetical protein HY260_01450 [Chloroflexi bacterium]|nr:hypothetical protein [Chloroflexota bacterium]